MYDEDYDNEEEQSSGNENNGGFNFKEFYEGNKKLILIVGGFLILLLILTIASKTGGGGTGGGNNKFTLTVSSTEESLRKNSSVGIIPTTKGSTNVQYKWESSDPNVATVDDKGVVSAVDLGNCVITVTATNEKGETQTANIAITVFSGTEGQTLTSVNFGGDGLVMTRGTTHNLTTNTVPKDAYVTSFEYASDNTTVCEVSDAGVISANAEGMCLVTVTANELITGSLKVFVKNETVSTHIITVPTDINFDKTEITLKVDEDQTINVSTVPANADSSVLTFGVDNSSIAKIEGNKITGLAEGTTNVTVSVGSLSKQIKVTVTSKKVELTGISVGNESVSLSVNGTEQIVVTTIPSEATEVQFSYTSSDSSVATVSSTGLITGVKAGTATITITANNGGNDVTKTVNVTVNGSSGSQDPPSGGGSCSSVGTIRVTSDNNAVNKTYTDVMRTSELKNAPSKITIELGNCTDTVKYCTYKYGTTACTPNTTYSAPFTISATGVTVIRYTVYYNGTARSGDPSERFVRLQNGTTGGTTTGDSKCWAYLETGTGKRKAAWSVSKPHSTAVEMKAIGTDKESKCTSIKNGKLCVIKRTGADAGKYYWDTDLSKLLDANYEYLASQPTETSCLSHNP